MPTTEQESQTRGQKAPKRIQVRLPGESNRVVLVGQTGTGKTVAGLWHLSNQNLERPWVVLNFKNDEHIDSIAHTQEIDFNYVPSKKDHGLFILRPLPWHCKRMRGNEPSTLENYLWKVWYREDMGIFCDETFMIGTNNDAFEALLTQGRSKLVPMICCTQRPVMISRFCFSEASFIQVFDLIDDRDIDTVEGFVPIDWDEYAPLGEHESFYFDVSRKQIYRWKPVPSMTEIRKVFKAKLHRKWRFI